MALRVYTVLAGLVAALVAGPTSQAQFFQPPGMTVSAKPLDMGPEGRLSPETELAEVVITVVLRFQPGTVCTTPYTLRFQVLSPPPWAAATLDPQTITATMPNYGTVDSSTVAHTARLLISTTRDAPAFRDDVYRVKVDLHTGAYSLGNGGVVCTLMPQQGEVQFTIKNDYVPRLEVSGPSLVQAGRPASLRVSNLGNGPTRVGMFVEPRNPDDFLFIRPPAELHLESRTRGPDASYEAVADIEYVRNGSRLATFDVKVVGGYDGAAVGTLEDVQHLTITVDAAGARFEAEPPEERTLPGPGALAGVVVAVLVALWFRRRHD